MTIMQYRKVSKTADQFSALGFGAMRLARRRGRIDEERVTQQVRGAIDAGVNYIDTAVPYHGSESERVPGRDLPAGFHALMVYQITNGILDRIGSGTTGMSADEVIENGLLMLWETLIFSYTCLERLGVSVSGPVLLCSPFNI